MPRTVKLGSRQLQFPSAELAELRDCNRILDDREALQARMKEDGYLFIRGLYQPETILTARRAVLEHFDRLNGIKPGTDLEDGMANFAAPHPPCMGKKVITHEPRVRNVLEGKPIFDFFRRFFGRDALSFDYKWMRGVRRGEFTGAHYDVVYMGRGSIDKLFTVWTPLSDVSTDLGSLALCVGSHNLPGFQKLRDTYGKMDVDRDRVSGWYADDPLEVIGKCGGQWHTADFKAGDVLIFTMFTMHMSSENLTDRWRLSTDTRFQPADEPVDERWVGENPKSHYAWYSEPEKMTTMAAMKEKWGV